MRWFLWLAALAGCDDTLFGVAKDGGGTTDPTETTGGFCAVRQIFASDCLACHSASAKLGGLDLETDPIATLVGQPSIAYTGTLVVAGDPDASLLFHKVAGTQASDQGGVMPPGAGLDPAGVEAIRTWIADGASAACGTTGTGTGTGYHPADFASGAVHGLEAKLQEQACTTCHGADLTGGTVGVSCDSCHAEITTDWRTNCTFCHGGANGDTTGAPPENIDDTTSPVAFAPHQTHGDTVLRETLDCVECHQKPTDVLSEGHLFVGDTTAAVAEVNFLGVSLGGAWTQGGGAGSCTVYCHGDGRGTGVVTETSGPKTCGSCHAAMTSNPNQWGGMSGEHEKHLADVGATCATCHPTTTDNTTIARPDLHLDGQPDVAITNGGTVVWDGDSCAGSCHFENHANERW